MDPTSEGVVFHQYYSQRWNGKIDHLQAMAGDCGSQTPKGVLSFMGNL